MCASAPRSIACSRPPARGWSRSASPAPVWWWWSGPEVVGCAARAATPRGLAMTAPAGAGGTWMWAPAGCGSRPTFVGCAVLRHLYDGRGRCRRRGYRFSVSPKAVDVESDRLPHQLFNFLGAGPSRNAAGEVRRVTGERGSFPLDDHRIAVHLVGPFRLACRRTLANVPDLSSAPRLPATVTVPGLVGWRNCRWLPD